MMKSKEYLITIVATVIATYALLHSVGMINIDKSGQLNDLKEKIEKLEEDKQFYKDKYIELANDYDDRMQELGINEWILTDTSR